MSTFIQALPEIWAEAVSVLIATVLAALLVVYCHGRRPFLEAGASFGIEAAAACLAISLIGMSAWFRAGGDALLDEFVSLGHCLDPLTQRGWNPTWAAVPFLASIALVKRSQVALAVAKEYGSNPETHSSFAVRLNVWGVIATTIALLIIVSGFYAVGLR